MSKVSWKCTPWLWLVLGSLLLLHNRKGWVSVQALPQLDLPPLLNPTPKPQIYYNGFPSSGQLQNVGDLDRDQRYGPPYRDDNNPDDGSDDFRVCTGCHYLNTYLSLQS